MKGYEILEKTLTTLKLDPVFGNPGTTEIPMLRGIKNYYLTLHDSIAVGMADGYAQYSDAASAVNLHSLPGLGNAISFINTAKWNRSPVVITAGQQDTRHIVYDPILSGDLLRTVSGLVKYSYEIKNPSEIPVAFRRAKAIAMTPPRGPVFLSVPMDMMDYEAENLHFSDVTVNTDFSDSAAIYEIADKINKSSHPAVVFGYEIDVYNAYSEAENFANKLGVEVYSEPLASRGTFNTENKLYGGDLLPASTLMNLKFLNNDLIIFIGGDITFYPYLPSQPFPGKEVIFVGTDISYKTGISYIVNPKIFLREAAKLIKKKGNYSRPRDFLYPNKIARQRITSGVDYTLFKAKKLFSDYTVIDEAISGSENVRATFGYGSKKYFTAKSGQLGWATAASLGIGLKNKKTLVIIGDGAFMYSVQGLWTAKRYNIPVKFLVLNNSGYNILKSFSKSYYPDMEGKDYFQLDLDIESIARGFGVETMTAGMDMSEMQWLHEGDVPKVLVVHTEKAAEKLFL
ncbi:thiamine pyrophosphate-binding protein [Ferroplasma sp.]|uniref:thiamine pyrophosphate-binding protein n=1 Tax=Ferroplasma sp. TaxID=2591003 RepID=UPI00307F0F6D